MPGCSRLWLALSALALAACGSATHKSFPPPADNGGSGDEPADDAAPPPVNPKDGGMANRPDGAATDAAAADKAGPNPDGILSSDAPSLRPDVPPAIPIPRSYPTGPGPASVTIGADGGLVTTPEPNGDVIPDFSNAGYGGGGVR